MSDRVGQSKRMVVYKEGWASAAAMALIFVDEMVGLLCCVNDERLRLPNAVGCLALQRPGAAVSRQLVKGHPLLPTMTSKSSDSKPSVVGKWVQLIAAVVTYRRVSSKPSTDQSCGLRRGKNIEDIEERTYRDQVEA